MTDSLRERIFSIGSEQDFLETAMQVFEYQYDTNPVYRDFVISLGRNPVSRQSLSELPFLPIEFFRTHKVLPPSLSVHKVFESSGTTGSLTSRHYVADTDIYRDSFIRSFRLFYGDPSDYMIAALLPSYTERENSSLVYMADSLIRMSGKAGSGFYSEKDDSLIANIRSCRESGVKVILLGVTFALLDLAERRAPDLSGVIVMETGGMKGRRPEITREELHRILKAAFSVPVIHSEYGMTELLSQAYSKGEGIFHTPPWMKIILRDPTDPLTYFMGPGRTGGINIIDLANLYSCSFLATSDLGKLHPGGRFEVLGRYDNSDIRGCNLLAES